MHADAKQGESPRVRENGHSANASLIVGLPVGLVVLSDGLDVGEPDGDAVGLLDGESEGDPARRSRLECIRVVAVRPFSGRHFWFCKNRAQRACTACLWKQLKTALECSHFFLQ